MPHLLLVVPLANCCTKVQLWKLYYLVVQRDQLFFLPRASTKHIAELPNDRIPVTVTLISIFNKFARPFTSRWLTVSSEFHMTELRLRFRCLTRSKASPVSTNALRIVRLLFFWQWGKPTLHKLHYKASLFLSCAP